ncbi:serine-threonine protein kinase 19 [Cystoisospora suis]|uniref:Serine-threonine protein kinase 19 n=1 Tax=Cystoisospora suis TaxID=483139 RepID=A0A2C6L811_9APIC|nr:serine-threonine protein kinase 19 [Cystoisospora suis]
MDDSTPQSLNEKECNTPFEEDGPVGLQSSHFTGDGEDEVSTKDEDTTPVISTLTPLHLEGVSRSPLLKKLLHFRDSMEPPLISLFGLPFVLRHQLGVSPCCPCCNRCCCCGVALRQFQENGKPRSSTDTSPHSDSAFTYKPCGISGCRCCQERREGGDDISRVFVSNHNQGLPQSGSASDPSGERTEESRRSGASTRCKRRRLVGDGNRDGGFLEHTVTQDEREVEILLARNVLRQIRLPIASGNLVLFFTEDWLALLRRCIRTAQRHALMQHEEIERTHGEEHMRSDIAEAPRREDSSRGLRNSSASYEPSSHLSEECSDGSTSRMKSTEMRAASCEKCEEASTHDRKESQSLQRQHPPGGVRSRRKALLDWPVLLGEQLAHVLRAKLLSVQTHTEVGSRSLRTVIKDYLVSWRQRRRDTGVLLRETLRNAKELRHRGNEVLSASVARQPSSVEQRTQVSSFASEHRLAESQAGQALERVWSILKRGIMAAEEVLTLREAAGLGVFPELTVSSITGTEHLQIKGENLASHGAMAHRDRKSSRLVSSDSMLTKGDADEAKAYKLLRLLLSDSGPGEEPSGSVEAPSASVAWPLVHAKSRHCRVNADQVLSARPGAGVTVTFKGPELNREAEEIVLLLHELNLARSVPDTSTVSLCIAQQGLLVRWLLGGRKEILGRLHARKFKELLWVDVERQGLLRTGLGSRMMLLDLQGKGDVEVVRIGGGLVVRLRGELRRGMRVFTPGS